MYGPKRTAIEKIKDTQLGVLDRLQIAIIADLESYDANP